MEKHAQKPCTSMRGPSWTFAGVRYDDGNTRCAKLPPPLIVSFAQDGSRLFSAGADKAVRAFDMNTGQNSQVAAHDAPVSCVRWIEAPSGGVIATGSWDKTVKVRDYHIYCDDNSSHHLF